MDTEALRNRRPIWKLVLSFLGILAGILIAFLIWLSRLSDRRWHDMERRVQEMKAEHKARIAPRPVLRGVATPGNAWDTYLPAINKLKGIGRGTITLFEYVSRHKDANRAAVEALLSEHGAVLDQLRKGAASAEGQLPWDWESMKNGSSLDILSPQSLANLAVCQARFLHEVGKSRAGADLLLDVAQLGRDLGDNSTLLHLMIGFAIQSRAFEELRELLSVKAHPSEDAATVAQGLEILDRTFPCLSAAFLCEGLYAGTTYLTSSDAGWAGVPRLMTIHAFFEYDRWMRQAAESEGGSWSESQTIARRIENEASSSWNPLIKVAAPTFLVRSSQLTREWRAQLRLLRMAAAYRASSQILELEDPFGTKLRHATVGDKLRLWSVGPDGVDDGGARGAWKAAPTGDLILEIER